MFSKLYCFAFYRSTIHLELIFKWSGHQFSFLLCIYQDYWRIYHFSLLYCATFVINQAFVCVRIYFWATFFSYSIVYLSVTLSHYADSQKSKVSVLFFTNILPIFGLFYFLTNFRINLPSFTPRRQMDFFFSYWDCMMCRLLWRDVYHLYNIECPNPEHKFIYLGL